MKRFLASLAMLAVAFGGTAVVAHAQNKAASDQVAQQQADSQPGVARVSLIEGNVSIQRADSGEWVAATVNTPLMNGDTISTGPSSRAEVQLDYANVLRLDSSSTVKIANLDRSNIQVQVAQGLVNLDVLVQDQAQTEIDTPNVAVHPLGNGEYRVEVDSNAQSLVTVRNGEADVSTPQGSTRVESGQLITVEGTNNPQYRISDAASQDAWDQWNTRRDRSIENAQSWHETNRYYTGSQSLDGYGRWIYVPGYGNVWQPYQSAGWAPYRNGRWVWEPYFGWTWVSYAPWGWAPYHYGRWFFYDSAWSWWPGPVAVYPAYYPVWAPAYVSFFGFGYAGAGFSFSVGFGNVGWIPCGPGDAYFPWYGRGRTFNVINITNINYIQNNYDRDRGFAPLFRGREGYSNYREVLANAHVRDGVSWMSSRDFGHAPVPRVQHHIEAATFQRGKLFSGRVPVLPTRQSLRSIDRAPNPNTTRRGIPANQRFFTNRHPAPKPTSFNQQRAQLERSIQGSRNQLGVRSGKPAFTSSARGGAVLGTGRPTIRNGSPSRTFVRPNQPAPNFTQTRNGWHNFGNANSPASTKGTRTGQGQPQRNFRINNRGASPAPAQRRGNFRSFTPAPRQPQPAQRNVSPAPSARPGWTTFSRQPGQQRNAPPARGSVSTPAPRQQGGRVFTPSSRPAPQGGSRSRQPLNLRQPIVQRPNGSSRPSPRRNFNNGARNFSRPSFGGGQVNRGGSPAYGGGGRTNRGGNTPSYRAPAPQRSIGGGSTNRGGGGFSRGASRPSAPRSRSGGSSRSSGGHGRGH